MDLKEIGGDGVDWSHQVHDSREQWQDVMDVKITKKELNFLNN